uniref:Uncharacterized protein n=1 Tax=Romanomermis culicivorax TaxID=13658 RepID=A0A915J4K3_ROMCU
MGQVRGLEMSVIWQSGCFAGQMRLKTLRCTGWWDNSQYWSCCNNQLWLSNHSCLSRRQGPRQQQRGVSYTGAVANVGAVGGSDMALGGSEFEDDVASSMSIGGGGGSGTLNTVCGGFFKASMRFFISASRRKGLM